MSCPGGMASKRGDVAVGVLDREVVRAPRRSRPVTIRILNHLEGRVAELIRRTLWSGMTAEGVHELVKCSKPSPEVCQFVIVAEVEVDNGAFLAGARLAQV